MFQLSSIIGRCVLGRQYAIQLQTEVKTRAQAVMPAPEEKNGVRAVACPDCRFRRSERQADAQAELPLVELGAIDFQEAPTGNIAIGVGEVW